MIPKQIIKCLDDKPELWNSGLVDYKDKYLLMGNTQDMNVKRYAFIDAATYQTVSPIGSFVSKQNFDFRTVRIKDKYYAIFFTKFASFRSGVVLQSFSIKDDLTLAWNQDRTLLEPVEDWKGYTKTAAEKNWMPFVHNGELYFVYSVSPHRILRFNEKTRKAQLVYESMGDFSSWPLRAHGLSGNANCVQIDDMFMGTFHSKPKRNYWTGYYFFDAKPPFKPLYLGGQALFEPSECVEPRKSERVQRCFDNVQFPIGLFRKDEAVLVSYGENDCLQKIARINITELTKNAIKI